MLPTSAVVNHIQPSSGVGACQGEVLEVKRRQEGHSEVPAGNVEALEHLAQPQTEAGAGHQVTSCSF